jgi:hypothetical protein
MENIFKRTFIMFLTLGLIQLSACNGIERQIIYCYNNICITRIENATKTHFSYGAVNKTTDRKSDVTIDWGRRDGGFRAYLVYLNDHVLLVREYGWFEAEPSTKQLTLATRFEETKTQFDNVKCIKWLDSLNGHFGTVRID